MPKVIVWRMPDNSVMVTAPNTELYGDTDAELERCAADTAALDPDGVGTALNHFIVEKAVSDPWFAAAARNLNGGKNGRDAWRLANAAARVPVIDATVLASLPVVDEATRKAALDAAIDGATTLAALKTVLKQALRG